MRVIGSVILGLMIVASPAAAKNLSAKTILKKEIREACGKAGGRLGRGAVIRKDLTGDGRRDLIVSHENIACRGGQRSGHCGAQVCSVNFYVRRAGGYRLNTEKLGIRVTVGKGKRPRIWMNAHGGQRYNVRWDGRRFR